MYFEKVRKLNQLFESPSLTKQVIDECNIIISQLDVGEQLGIHADLSNISLEAVYKYRDQLDFNNGAKEHIVWLYFRNLVNDSSHLISDSLLDEITERYVQVNSIALESIIIYLIKFERVTEGQLAKMKLVYQSNVFRKHAATFEATILLKNGSSLNVEMVQKLLGSKAFEFLEYAIDRKVITKDSYRLFSCPIQGECFRKVKQRLFDKVQNLMAQ